MPPIVYAQSFITSICCAILLSLSLLDMLSPGRRHYPMVRLLKQMHDSSNIHLHAHRTVEIDGAVEYKSLPSGLHNVHEDLV